MKNYVLLFLLLIGISNPLLAQDDATFDYQPRKSRFIEINGTLTCPLMDLDANHYKDAIGLSLAGYGDLTSNRKPFVFQWGLEGRVQGSGKSGRYTIYTNPGYEEIYRPTNMAIAMNGLVRLKYQALPVHPFIDGFVGGNIFTSGYHTEEYDYYDDSYTDQWNGVVTNGQWGYGVGAGVQVPVSQRVAINFRAAYTHTPEMSYIDMEDVIDNQREVLNPAVSSDYDALSYNLGVSIKLDRKRKQNRIQEDDCDCNCDCERIERRERRERRRRDCNRGSIFFDILMGELGGCSTVPPPPCPPSYPVPSTPPPPPPVNDNWNDNNDGDNWNDDNPSCPPAYEPSIYEPATIEDKPDRGGQPSVPATPPATIDEVPDRAGKPKDVPPHRPNMSKKSPGKIGKNIPSVFKKPSGKIGGNRSSLPKKSPSKIGGKRN